MAKKYTKDEVVNLADKLENIYNKYYQKDELRDVLKAVPCMDDIDNYTLNDVKKSAKSTIKMLTKIANSSNAAIADLNKFLEEL